MTIFSHRNKIYIVLTVDWEVDTAQYASKTHEIDYGGILVGTQAFEEILDELKVPCTWLIENSKDIVSRDLPSVFPDVVRRLSNREKDEIGVHIHWARQIPGTRHYQYPTNDVNWVGDQLRHAKKGLADFGINAISFRGGAFLPVSELPHLLEATGYLNDSSTLYSRSERRIPNLQGSLEKKSVLERVTSLIINIINPFPRPYFCDYNDVELEGKSKVLELTTNFHLFQRSALSALFQFPLLMRRIKMAKCDLFLVAFFHIHELTVPGTGPNELTKLDQSSIIKVRKMLKSLQCIENVQFVTLSEARKILTS